MAKSNGQMLVERAESFVARYVAFPEGLKDQALLMAIWAIHTWVFERVSSTPFLSITAPSKGAGKTLTMEIVGMLSRTCKTFLTIRPLMLVRCIESFDQKLTIALDEAEKLSSSAFGDTRSIMAGGYRRGAVHGITVGKSWEEFRTFCPKMFATIGDVLSDVVRDRCIVVRLIKATPPVNFFGERPRAEAEAVAIKGEVLAMTMGLAVPIVEPMFLVDREREIWTALFSVATALKLDADTMRRLEAVAMDLVALKAGPRARAVDYEDRTADDRAAVQAMTDLRAIFREGERHVFSSVVIERLKEIPTSPWRAYLGEGLDEIKLAALVGRFGVGPKDGRMVSGRKGAVRKGYSASEVRAVKLEGGQS